MEVSLDKVVYRNRESHAVGYAENVKLVTGMILHYRSMTYPEHTIQPPSHT